MVNEKTNKMNSKGKNRFQKMTLVLLGLILGLSVIVTVGSTPAQAATTKASTSKTSSAASQTLYSWSKGKTVSILGASISTFDGYGVPGYEMWYPANSKTIKKVSQTWWMQVINQTGMKLGTNASYSGSPVSGKLNDETGFYYISNTRVMSLCVTDPKTGLAVAPDLIIVKGGTNDMFLGRSLGEYWPGKKLMNTTETDIFTDAYDYLLTILQKVYPTSKILCLTCTQVYDPDKNYQEYVNDHKNTINDYDEMIIAIANAHNIPVIDTRNAGLTVSETEDGTHPNAKGATKLANYIVSQMKKIQVK